MLTTLLWTALASAQTPVPISVALPDTVPFPAQTIVLNGVGRADGDDCAGAAQLAIADLEHERGRYGATHVIGVYEEYAHREPLATQAECTYKGKPTNPKKSVVKIQGLGIAAGSGPAFPTVTTERAREIAAALTADKSISVAAQIMSAPTRALVGNGAQEAWTVAEEIRDGLYYPEWSETIEEGFLPEHNRSTRAATVFNRIIAPQLDGLATKARAVPELRGVVLYSGATHPNQEWELVSESYRFVVPSAALIDHQEGRLSGQALLDACQVEYEQSGMWTPASVTLASALD